MGYTNFPHGITSMGVPVLPGSDAPVTGNIYWVGSAAGTSWVAGSNTADGSKDRPYATIDYAIDQCAANNGDVIYVLPGHAENISAAGKVTCDKAGISIIGLGTGLKRPTLTWTATAGTFLISANNVTVENIYCDVTGIDAVVTPFSLTSAGGFTTLRNIEVYHAKTSYVALMGFLTASTAAAANGLFIDGCYVHGDAAANTTNAVQLVGGDRVRIINSRFVGAYTTTLGPINNITAALTNCLISGNVLVNTTASAAKVIVLLTGSTGQIVNNRMGVLTGTAPITADAVEAVGGNYYKAAAGVAAGTLL